MGGFLMTCADALNAVRFFAAARLVKNAVNTVCWVLTAFFVTKMKHNVSGWKPLFPNQLSNAL